MNSSEGAAFVTEQNVRGTNGIIHVIDNVLFKTEEDNQNKNNDKTSQNGHQKPVSNGNNVHKRPGNKNATKKPTTSKNPQTNLNNGHKFSNKNGNNNVNQLPQYNNGQKSGQTGHFRRQKSHGGRQSYRNERRQPRIQRGRQQTRQRPQQQSQRRRYQRRYRY